MFERHLADALVAAAATNPVVTLTGPRQSGKTTLVRALFPSHRYISLERPDLRLRAAEDPAGLLASGERLVLDEIQRVPELLSYIQVLVDEDARPGRFILTGSQNVLLMRAVAQTLAGRTAFLRLYPLSLAELRGKPRLDVERLDQPGAAAARPEPPPAGLWETLARGFYPRIHDRNLVPQEWLADYLSAYLERDLREIARVDDLRGFERFVRLAAAHTGRELNLTALATDVGVAQQTAKRWLTALEIGYLATTLAPHHANYRKRLRKRPRLHFLDSGLVCHLLGIRDGATLANHPLRGAIFESFVVAEFLKSAAAVRRDAPLFLARRHRPRNRRHHRRRRPAHPGGGEVRADRGARCVENGALVDLPAHQSQHWRRACAWRCRALRLQGDSSAALVLGLARPAGRVRVAGGRFQFAGSKRRASQT